MIDSEPRRFKLPCGSQSHRGRWLRRSPSGSLAFQMPQSSGLRRWSKKIVTMACLYRSKASSSARGRAAGFTICACAHVHVWVCMRARRARARLRRGSFCSSRIPFFFVTQGKVHVELGLDGHWMCLGCLLPVCSPAPDINDTGEVCGSCLLEFRPG